VRAEMAKVCLEMANKCGDPPLVNRADYASRKWGPATWRHFEEGFRMKKTLAAFAMLAALAGSLAATPASCTRAALS